MKNQSDISVDSSHSILKPEKQSAGTPSTGPVVRGILKTGSSANQPSVPTISKLDLIPPNMQDTGLADTPHGILKRDDSESQPDVDNLQPQSILKHGTGSSVVLTASIEKGSMLSPPETGGVVMHKKDTEEDHNCERTKIPSVVMLGRNLEQQEPSESSRRGILKEPSFEVEGSADVHGILKNTEAVQSSHGSR